jgi:hypothetical protein
MGNKHRRRKHRFNKKKTILFVKIATVTSAVILAVLLGIYIPKSLNENESSIEMTKEYAPGKDIISSLKRNEEIVGLIDEEVSEDSQRNIDSKNSVSEDSPINIDYKNGVAEDNPINIDSKNGNSEVDEIEEQTSDGVTDDQSMELDVIVQNQEYSQITVEDRNKEIPEDTQSINTELAVDKTTSEEKVDETTPEENVEINNSINEKKVQYVKDEWVDDMIQDNKDSISDADLEKGAAIYNQLDTKTIISLVEGGITAEEEILLTEYLESNLSPEQLELAKVLFSKYIGLVD